MNVASLELCKELYEVSRWNSSYGLKYWKDGNLIDVIDIPCFPAYDLGYLLRKLEDLESLTLHRCHHQDNSYNWEVKCYTPDNQDVTWFKSAESPEDATTQLAIELFKQGILKC